MHQQMLSSVSTSGCWCFPRDQSIFFPGSPGGGLSQCCQHPRLCPAATRVLTEPIPTLLSPPAGAEAGAECFFPHVCWISALCYNWFFADVRERAAFPPWTSVSIRDSVTSTRNPGSAELCRSPTVTAFFFPSFYSLPPPGPFSSTNGEISFKLGLD